MSSGIATLPMSCSGADLNSSWMWRGQLGGERRVIAQRFAERQHVMLGAPDVVAGFVVARFDQRAESRDRRALRGDQLGGALGELIRLLLDFSRAFGDQDFERLVLLLQRLARLAQSQVVAHARQHHRRR
jgi:hypothetical protein